MNEYILFWPHIGHSGNGFKGVTKREYFAAMAMQALLKDAYTDRIINESEGTQIKQVVKASIIAADELLKQLSND